MWQRRNNPNISAFKDFSPLSPRVQDHLKNVYITLAAAILACSVGIYINLRTGFGNSVFLHLFGSIFLIAWLYNTPHTEENFSKRAGIFVSIALLEGFIMSPLIGFAVEVDPNIVATAFFMTTAIFVAFSASAFMAEKRSLLYLGGLLGSAITMLLIGTLLSLILRIEMLMMATVYFGLLIFCGYVMYDTQVIIEKAKMGEDDYVVHALELFLDFVNIFVRILRILLKDKKKE